MSWQSIVSRALRGRTPWASDSRGNGPNSGRAASRRWRRLASELLEQRRLLAVAELVTTINATADAAPSKIVGSGGAAYFAATTPTHGRELWSILPTSKYWQVHATVFGSGSSNPEGLLAAPLYGGLDSDRADDGREAFFWAYTSEHGRELWSARAGGTPNGSLLGDINVGVAGSQVQSTPPARLDGNQAKMYFAANDGQHGAELWQYDVNAIYGTAKTQLVRDLRPGAAGSSLTPPFVAGNQLFFFANDGTTGLELWRSDGTQSGTVLVRDIRPGSGSSLPVGGSPNFWNVNGQVFFFADDRVTGLELWKSNGTASGTVLVRDANPGVDGLALGPPTASLVAGSTLYYAARTGGSADQLWQSDGTSGGTRPVDSELTLWVGGQAATVLEPNTALAAVGSSVLFPAINTTNGMRGLYRADLGGTGATLVRSFAQLAASPDRFMTVAGTLYFTASETADGDYELWRSDGTSAGTQRVIDLSPGSASSFPRQFFNANGRLFFSASQGGLAWAPRLWMSDGTPAGTEAIGFGNASTLLEPQALGVAYDDLVIVARTTTGGSELYILPGINALPQARMVPLHLVQPGQTLALNADASFDTDPGDVLSFSWDLNNDEVFDDATGANPTLSWSELTALGVQPGPLRVRVRDSRGGEAVAQSELAYTSLEQRAALYALTTDFGRTIAAETTSAAYLNEAGDRFTLWRFPKDGGAPQAIDGAGQATFLLGQDGDLVYFVRGESSSFERYSKSPDGLPDMRTKISQGEVWVLDDALPGTAPRPLFSLGDEGESTFHNLFVDRGELYVETWRIETETTWRGTRHEITLSRWSGAVLEPMVTYLSDDWRGDIAERSYGFENGRLLEDYWSDSSYADPPYYSSHYVTDTTFWINGTPVRIGPRSLYSKEDSYHYPYAYDHNEGLELRRSVELDGRLYLELNDDYYYFLMNPCRDEECEDPEPPVDIKREHLELLVESPTPGRQRLWTTDSFTLLGSAGGRLVILTADELRTHDVETGLQETILTNAGNILPSWSHQASGRFYFGRGESTYHGELWVTDGTAAGTRLVVDTIPSGARGLNGPYIIGDRQGAVLFEAAGDVWVTDPLDGRVANLTQEQPLVSLDDWRVLGGSDNEVWVGAVAWNSTFSSIETALGVFAVDISAFASQPNGPPVARAGGPYAITAGDTLVLDGSASSDPTPGDTLSYSWDVDGDGAFDDATGATPTLTWAALHALGLAPTGQFTVRVRVSDGTSTRTSPPTTLVITPPTLHAVPAGGEVRVNATTANQQKIPRLATDAAGNYVVTWTSLNQDGSSWGVYAQRYSAAGEPRGGEFRVHTVTAGVQREPAVAVDADGDFLITWNAKNPDDLDYGIYAQRYNAAGQPLGSEFRVNADPAGSQRSPAAAFTPDGGFWIAWWGNRTGGDSGGVYFRRFDAAGAPLAPEAGLNTEWVGIQDSVSLASDGVGQMLAVWDSSNLDGTDSDVYLRRFTFAGAPLGPETRINSFLPGEQEDPWVAADRYGGAVIAWSSAGQNGEPWGVYAQRYAPSGALRGGELKLNTTAATVLPDVTAAIDQWGQVSAAWHQDGDGSGLGVWLARLRPEGTPLGQVERINSHNLLAQTGAAVAAAPDGRLVVAWQSDGQDGSGFGIYSRRYAVTALGRQGDADADGVVGTSDYTIWAAQFGSTGPGLAADFDRNGVVGLSDYALWASGFGRSGMAAGGGNGSAGSSQLGATPPGATVTAQAAAARQATASTQTAGSKFAAAWARHQRQTSATQTVAAHTAATDRLFGDLGQSDDRGL